MQEAEAYAEYLHAMRGEEESAAQPPYHMLPMQALDHGCLDPGVGSPCRVWQRPRMLLPRRVPLDPDVAAVSRSTRPRQ
jgi:hypothetical protein